VWVIGATGRMGSAACHAVEAADDLELSPASAEVTRSTRCTAPTSRSS
jgi:dihydrodipicolinate reductase